MQAADILTPLPPQQFIDKVYGRRAALLGEPSGRFAGLLPWDVLQFALVHRRVEGLRMRVMQDGRSVPATEFARTIPTRRGGNLTTLRADTVAELLRAGATLAIDDIEEFVEDVAELALDVERLLRESVGVNAYVTGGNTPGFALHWDPHDVLAVQVMGHKIWRVYGPTRESPLVRDYAPAPAPEGEPPEVFDLQAGQVLYLPRGWWHAVEATGEPSVHLAVGVRRRTGVDLVEWLADVLRARSEFRADIPRLSPERHESHMRALRSVLDELWDGDLLRRYLAEDESTAPVRRRLPVPDALTHDCRPFAPRDRVWLLAARPVLDHQRDTVAVAMDSQRWTFHRFYMPILVRLCGGGSHTVAELATSLAGVSPEAAAQAADHVLQRLQAAGLLQVTRASG